MTIEEKLDEIRQAIHEVIDEYRYKPADEENRKAVQRDVKKALKAIIEDIKVKAIVDENGLHLIIKDSVKEYNVTIDNEL